MTDIVRPVDSSTEIAESRKYALDPDFRRDAPRDGPYCVRCQRPLSEVSKAIRVTVDWDTWMVVLGGEELIGRDCWEDIGGQVDESK